MIVAGYIPSDVVASVSGATIIAVVYLSRSLSKLAERVSRLEGRFDEKEGKA